MLLLQTDGRGVKRQEGKLFPWGIRAAGHRGGVGAPVGAQDTPHASRLGQCHTVAHEPWPKRGGAGGTRSGLPTCPVRSRVLLGVKGPVLPPQRDTRGTLPNHQAVSLLIQQKTFLSLFFPFYFLYFFRN